MSKINTNKIQNKLVAGLNKTFISIAILALGFFATQALAAERAYVSGYTPPAPVQEEKTVKQVVAPAITDISPDEVKAGAGARTVTITGRGFTPSSVAKVNGANRYTTFIDDSHLLAQATAYDFYRTDGGFYVAVWNANGDYSNAAFVKVAGTAPAPANQSNNNPNQNQNYGNGGYDNTPINYYPGTIENVETDPETNSSLASSVILGGNTFLPTGIVQWVLVAIFIVFIIVLGRKVFRAREHYDSAPLKHA